MWRMHPGTTQGQSDSGIRPWCDGEPVFPINAVTNRVYNGINISLLWLSANRNGYEHDRWLTSRQAITAGGSEKLSLAVLYLPQERKVKDASRSSLPDSNGDPVIQHYALLREFWLFNIAQCEGLSLQQPVIHTDTPVEVAETMICASGGLMTTRSAMCS